MTRLILRALAMGAALVSAMPAIAQDDISIHVSYADLNLDSPVGVAVFRHRLDDAVIRICGRPDGLDIRPAQVVNACRNSAGLGVEHQVRRAIASAQTSMLASARSDPSRR